MSFKPIYVPKEQTAEQVAEDQKLRKETKQAAKDGYKRNLQALDQLRQQQAIDLEAERKQLEAAANKPVQPSDTVDLSKVIIVNGKAVEKHQLVPSGTVAKIAAMTAANYKQMQNRR